GDIALQHGPELARLGIDVRRVARVRRGIQVIAAEAGAASARIDGVSRLGGTCTAAWWRVAGPDALLLADLDRPWSTLPSGLAWRADQPIVMFPVAGCGAAVALDGAQWLDTTAAIPLDDPLTVELWWHPRLDRLPRLAEDRALLWQHGGELQVRVAGGRLRAEMGRCAAGGPAFEVVGPPLIEIEDRIFQELEVLFDFTAPRLCLARNGRPIGCVSSTTDPSCVLEAPVAAPLRFGARDTPASGWEGAIDEIRVRRGTRSFPGAAGPSTRQCFVDRACAPGGPTSVRDLGSRLCVDASAATCASISACPDHARDGTRCGAGTVPCAVGHADCGLGVGRCDSASACMHLDACADALGAELGACVPPP
ncbi:MAG: hypothetical protein M3Y87_32165, partial [Myxococcota bacterium]|nr:hypothetical protein [Myxococcota bacterium]